MQARENTDCPSHESAQHVALTGLAPLLVRVEVPAALIAQLLPRDLRDTELKAALDECSFALVRLMARALTTGDCHLADLIDLALIACNRLVLSAEIAGRNPTVAEHLIQRAKGALYQAAIAELSRHARGSAPTTTVMGALRMTGW